MSIADCRRHISIHYKGHIQFFCNLQLYDKINVKLRFLILSSFAVQFEDAKNFLGDQN